MQKMTNTNKLKAKIVEHNFTIMSLAKEIGISKTSLSQKINNKVRFSQSNIKDITRLLDLNGADVIDIFLN